MPAKNKEEKPGKGHKNQTVFVAREKMREASV
jgi:hypothetical protein